MINHQVMTAEEFTDTELVARSLAGDREAFSRIVTRYQILICSLAYSRIGHLGQSEDVAQETFITAWKRLRLLREPAKLRAWLCGIVNYRIHKALRREGREPVRQAETLEIIEESPAVEALPSEQAISREEEAILWRALEKVPELYRQPLVLFYREHESIEAVAAEIIAGGGAVVRGKHAPTDGAGTGVFRGRAGGVADGTGSNCQCRGGQKCCGSQVRFAGRMAGSAGAIYWHCPWSFVAMADYPFHPAGRTRTPGQILRTLCGVDVRDWAGMGRGSCGAHTGPPFRVERPDIVLCALLLLVALCHRPDCVVHGDGPAGFGLAPEA
jgi:RNA polymerase sigma factor (sigma-70 family)